MKIARTILIVLIGCFLFLLAGCSAGGSTEDKLIGVWEVNLKIIHSFVKYNKDHTYTFVFAGLKNKEESGQWQIEGDELITILKNSTDSRARHIGEKFVSKIVAIDQKKLVLQAMRGNGMDVEYKRVGDLDDSAFRFYLAKWYEEHNSNNMALEEYITKGRLLSSVLEFTISKDAKKIYYLRPDKVLTTSGEYGKSLWEYDLNSKKSRRLDDAEFENAYCLRLSPDGTHLIFLTRAPSYIKNGHRAIKIFNLKNDVMASLEGANQFSFIDYQKIMFGAGDTIYEYNLANGVKTEVANKIHQAATNVIGYAKGGAAIFYRKGQDILKIPIPLQKTSAKEFLGVLAL